MLVKPVATFASPSSQSVFIPVPSTAPHVLARRLCGGEACQILGHRKKLEDADPALVAGLVATRTAFLPIEGHAVARSRHVWRDARRDHLVDGRSVHLAAVRAQLSRETLSKHTCHGGTGEERLDPVGFAKPVRGSPASVGSGKVDAG